MRRLPKIRYKSVEYFFDEWFAELRDVDLPWVSIPLQDYEVMWIKCTGTCPGDIVIDGRRRRHRELVERA